MYIYIYHDPKQRPYSLALGPSSSFLAWSLSILRRILPACDLGTSLMKRTPPRNFLGGATRSFSQATMSFANASLSSTP